MNPTGLHATRSWLLTGSHICTLSSVPPSPHLDPHRVPHIPRSLFPARCVLSTLWGRSSRAICWSQFVMGDAGAVGLGLVFRGVFCLPFSFLSCNRELSQPNPRTVCTLKYFHITPYLFNSSLHRTSDYFCHLLWTWGSSQTWVGSACGIDLIIQVSPIHGAYIIFFTLVWGFLGFDFVVFVNCPSGLRWLMILQAESKTHYFIAVELAQRSIHADAATLCVLRAFSSSHNKY